MASLRPRPGLLLETPRARWRRRLAGRCGELLNLAAPRLSDALMSRHHRRSPDSAAARGSVDPRG